MKYERFSAEEIREFEDSVLGPKRSEALEWLLAVIVVALVYGLIFLGWATLNPYG